MPDRKKRPDRQFVAVPLALVVFCVSMVSAIPASQAEAARNHNNYLPVAVNQPLSSDPFSMLNRMRFYAGVPAAAEDPDLGENCYEHARYMAENDDLTHEQNPNLPYASPDGQQCAERANTWLSHVENNPDWDIVDPIEGWSSSVAHRLWLLYPTTTAFGYGYYETESHRAGAAIDVFSHADFTRDEAFQGWPVRYPGINETDLPSSRFPITMNWRYFGPEPVINSTRLKVKDGASIPHHANTFLPAGHKGIQILPDSALPANSTIIVSVSGLYEDTPFSYRWEFHTGLP